MTPASAAESSSLPRRPSVFRCSDRTAILLIVWGNVTGVLPQGTHKVAARPSGR